jgi:hypothetical protein
MANLFSLVVMVAALSTAVGVGIIAFAVTEGFNEHIRAMPGIYDEIKKLKQ